jgi:hypothetical protein
MALIERLMGLEEPRIPIHQFQAIAAEWARGNMTGAQAQDAIATCSQRFPGDPLAPLDSAAVAEAQALVNTVPTGSTTENKADRAIRWFVIDQVLLIASQATPPYDTAAAVRTRLGI